MCVLIVNSAMNGNDRRGCLVSERTKSPNGIETKTDADICSYCGSIVETSKWHPVVADDDGSGFRIQAFCDERCRTRWEE